MKNNMNGVLLTVIMSISTMALNASFSSYDDSLNHSIEAYNTDSLDMLDRAAETDDLKQEIRLSLENEQSVKILEKLDFAGLLDYKKLRYLVCVLHKGSATKEQIKVKLSNVLHSLRSYNKGLQQFKDDNLFDSSSDEFEMIDQLAQAYNIEEGSTEQSILAFRLVLLELPYILQGSYC